MIEVVPNETPEKPKITDQLALSGINVVRDYTRDCECYECVFLEVCENCFKGCPRDWEV